MTSYSAVIQSFTVTLQYFDAWNVAGQVWAETPQNFFCSTNNVLILYFILNPGLTVAYSKSAQNNDQRSDGWYLHKLRFKYTGD